jgi:hypothetical protein
MPCNVLIGIGAAVRPWYNARHRQINRLSFSPRTQPILTPFTRLLFRPYLEHHVRRSTEQAQTGHVLTKATSIWNSRPPKGRSHEQK